MNKMSKLFKALWIILKVLFWLSVGLIVLALVGWGALALALMAFFVYILIFQEGANSAR